MFLDGTANDRDSRTNVSVLSEIIKHQDKDNLFIFYNEGPGTDGRMLGAATGWGIAKDVREAYAFLSQYYERESKLYIFGFSRGAYTARMLAGMLFSIGLYDLKDFKESDRGNIVKELYCAYKGKDKGKGDIHKEGRAIIARARSLPITASETELKFYNDVTIDVMGLWDTVEALGLVPSVRALGRKIDRLFGKKSLPNITTPNDRYFDQICNVKHIYHALSLDDNRAFVFVPIIMTSDHVVPQDSECKDKETEIAKVEEVWFAGSHADVGGGYNKDERNKDDKNTSDKDVSLSGVSLNWMMSRIKDVAPNLLPKDAKVYQNHLAYSHDAESGIKIAYEDYRRTEILTMLYLQESEYEKINIHSSVFDRIQEIAKGRQNMGFDSEWYKDPYFKDCFEDPKNNNYKFKECSLIKRVDKGYMQ